VWNLPERLRSKLDRTETGGVMQARPFEHFLQHLSSLTRRQRERLLAVLVPAARHDQAVDVIEQARAQLACPHCQSRQRGAKATKRGISNEQMCILVARDRTGQTLDWVPGKGTVTRAQLLQHLFPRLERDVLLVSDGHPAYRAFAQETGITHEAVNLKAGIRVRGAIHVQNVNAYHSRLRGWLMPFRGVASRYLANYLGWRWALDGGRIRTPEGLLRAALGVQLLARSHT
jgi:IS1 family transposase